MITDTDRIEWIEQYHPTVHCPGDFVEFRIDGKPFDGEGSTLREAIDDAMRQTVEYWNEKSANLRPEKYR